MEPETLTIQDCILQKDKFQDYECQICFSLALKPVECCGPCHNRFCAKCVSTWKILQDKCPLKCSQLFTVKVIEKPNYVFMCPFSSQQCTVQLHSITDFENHYQNCEYISTQQFKINQLKQQYKCFDGHELEFFMGSYFEMCESICTSCKQKKLCRSVCRKCNQLYCVYCRPPRCSSQCCPLGHKFNEQTWNYNGYICDLCGVSTAVTNEGVHDDPLCNFGICGSCYKNLPTQNQNHKQLMKNPYKCNQGHELKMNLPQKSFKKCFNCQRFSYCPKECEICDQVYCLQCKIGIVLQCNTCYKGHQLLKYEHMNTNENCIRCLQPSSMYYDPKCQFSLCEYCYNFQNNILDNKNRFIEQIKCMNGHHLCYYTGQVQQIDQCCLCKKNNVVRLFCQYCQAGKKIYCFNCKPLKNINHQKLCYFGHELQNYITNELMHCSRCENTEHKFKKCGKCYYLLCLECYPKQ